MSPQEIQVYRMALSKTLNMLSTKSAIVKPLPIDGQELIYRVNLADYDLHLPHGLASPTQPLVRIGRWKEVFEYRRPARDSAAEDQYFSERYVVRPPEYLGDTSAPCVPKDPRLYHCDANLSWMQSVMTLNNPVEADGNPVLAAYVAAKGKRSDDKSHRLHRITFREVNDDVILADVDSVNDTGILKLGVTDDKGNEKTPDSDDIIKLAEAPVVKQNPNLPHDSQSNPLSFSHEHTPVPLMRGEWFISQVAANYKQRVYYHLAGIPDDTGVLDIALGIDDEGALVRDNEPDQTGKSLKPIIMRAGFTNSGVSKNHRILERIETQQFPNKALWRSYEFDPYDSSTKGRYNDVLNYPFGPILFPNDSGGLGYECVDMFSSPNELFKNLETLKPISDWASRYWTQTPINVEQYRPTRITSRATFKALSEGDQQIYQQYWGNQPGNDLSVPLNNVPRVPAGRATSDIKNCESNRESNKLFNFHGFEYQFMRPNGLQGFATVGTNAFISDLKVANDSAGLNFGIVTVNDPKMGTVVIQPLSCLSCHTRGLIPKDDQIREYVSRNAGSGGLFTQKHVDKASRIYVEKKDFSAKMSADNKIITDAIEATGATISDQEPIVIVYNKYARSPITLEIAAAAVGVTPTDLATVLVQARSSADPEIQSMAQDLSGLANVGAGQFSSREKFEKYLPRLIRLVVTSGKIGY
jgi:hypothetical protein